MSRANTKGTSLVTPQAHCEQVNVEAESRRQIRQLSLASQGSFEQNGKTRGGRHFRKKMDRFTPRSKQKSLTMPDDPKDKTKGRRLDRALLQIYFLQH